MNTHIASLPFPLLVSRICLGINVYQINIEREAKKGKENLVRVSTIMTRNVAHRQNKSTYIIYNKVRS